MPTKTSLRNAFTFVEILTTLVIIGVLISISVVFVGNMAEQTHYTADSKTLATLNDALNYYKSVGGDIEGLTQDVSITYVIEKLKTPISHWGTTYQFLPEGKTFKAASIQASGYGDYFRFTRYDTYQKEGSAPIELAAVSANGTINYLQSFTPTIISGSKSGSYEMSWGGTSNWQALGSYTPASAGTYNFYVRNAEVSELSNTDASGPYTLTVNQIAQAAVSSSSATITYGQSYTPTVSGGSGTGTWQMSWNSSSSWVALAAYTPSAAGSETFYIRKYGDTNYLVSSTAGAYTLTINKANQAAVTSAGGSISCGGSFTPSVSGGSGTGAYQMYWTDVGSWQSVASRTFASSGSYTFKVRRAADANYNISSESTTYTLTVNSLSQAVVSSTGGTIDYLDSFTPVITGGSGSGDYQMSWGDNSSWESVAAHTPSSAGTEEFYARRLNSGCYLTSDVAGPYTLTVNQIAQGAVTSAGDSISCGGSFTPSASGGSGTGAYQMYWTDVGSWQSVASRTFSSTGSYTFKVRRLGDTNYLVSSESTTYTLTVSTVAQAAVTSANGTITYGDSFTPTTAGGSGTGDYQMSWGDSSSWEALAAYTPSAAGSETFYVRRAAAGCYAVSATSSAYTLTIDKADQAAVTAANASISCGGSFTPAATGGSGTGEYQMYWTDVGSWQTLASRTFASAGSYTVKLRRAADTNYNISSESTTYTLTVNLISQAAVSSASDTITYGDSFTPSYSGGSAGTWQMYWSDTTTWQTLASRSGLGAGSYTFYVRRAASGCYATSSQSSLYTLTVNQASQAAVTSANGSINCGSSFTPSTSGGSGTGAYQMYWSDVGSWQTLASRTFSSSGSYTFYVRRAADSNYLVSATSSAYTLTVNLVSQASVSSSSSSISCGGSFTPSTSGGSAGTWQMYWTDVGSWQTLASRTFSSAGSYTFRVRRAASGCYTTSSQSSLYTLTVNLVSQAAVSSANGTINNGDSFTPSTSGGSAGTWQMYWTDVGSWQTLASRTFSSAGSYTFRVRRAASGCYATSAQSSLYTLTVKYPAGTITITTSGATTYDYNYWRDSIYEDQSFNISWSWSNMASVLEHSAGGQEHTSTAASGSGSDSVGFYTGYIHDVYAGRESMYDALPSPKSLWHGVYIEGTDLNGDPVSRVSAGMGIMER